MSRSKAPGEVWTAIVKDNGAKLFQTALLLCADPDKAEACLIATICDSDISRAPAPNEPALFQAQLVRNAVQSVGPAVSSKIDEASSMLQHDLRPILLVERSPRLCFVLRVLLGYATSVCTQILGVDETAIRELLRIAIVQLHHFSSEHISMKLCQADTPGQRWPPS
jgi:hypothetical protein